MVLNSFRQSSILVIQRGEKVIFPASEGLDYIKISYWFISEFDSKPLFKNELSIFI